MSATTSVYKLRRRITELEQAILSLHLRAKACYGERPDGSMDYDRVVGYEVDADDYRAAQRLAGLKPPWDVTVRVLGGGHA